MSSTVETGHWWSSSEINASLELVAEAKSVLSVTQPAWRSIRWAIETRAENRDRVASNSSGSPWYRRAPD